MIVVESRARAAPAGQRVTTSGLGRKVVVAGDGVNAHSSHTGLDAGRAGHHVAEVAESKPEFALEGIHVERGPGRHRELVLLATRGRIGRGEAWPTREPVQVDDHLDA